MRKKGRLTYREQRESVRTHLAQAIANNDFPEQERLYGNLLWLDKKIEKEKK
jgi:hypothetical protein